MGHGRRLLRPGHLHQNLGNQGPGKGGGQGVMSFVEGVCLQRWKDKFVDKAFLGVLHQRFGGAGVKGFLLNCGEVTLVTHVHGNGNDLQTIFLLKPAYGHRGI